MNNNLYRGKTKDTKRWLEGYYVVANEHHYISLPLDVVSTSVVKCTDAETLNNINLSTLAPFLEVIPETLGQCTGKFDKNGKKIYDGDIVKVSGYSNYYALIEYDNSCGCYYAVNHEVQLPVELGNLKSKFIEIVGNVFDNEELLNVRHRWWRLKDEI